MNNTVITYYTEIPNFGTSVNNKDLLKLWKRNWEDSGWKVVVLDDDYAKANKQLKYFNLYDENSLLVRNSRLNKKYLWNCYLRWFAYTKYVEENGTCLWSDFDVMNCGLTPEKLSSKNIPVDTAFNGSLCSGILSPDGSKTLLQNIKLLNEEDENIILKINMFLKTVLNKDINDMVVLGALNTFKINSICTCLRMKQINQELIPFNLDGSYKKETYPLIHFHHGVICDNNFLNFDEITSKNRSEIVNHFFKTYLNQAVFNMKRNDIINYLIKKYNYKSYLEIGTLAGDCFKQIEINNKISVDPVKRFPSLDYEMTSDEFFIINNRTFDIIFIDGLHLEEQCTKDIFNSLSVLNPNGTIVIHDCLPLKEEYIDPKMAEKVTGPWWGTVFRSIIELRYKNPELQLNVIDTDCGCGIIRKTKPFQTVYNKVSIEEAKTFCYYTNNKKELMKIISVEEFVQLY